MEEIVQVIVKTFGPALKAIGGILKTINPLLDALFSLSAEEEAAAGLRVLVNEVKDLNKELKESQAEAGKLQKTIETFTDLSRLGFRSSGQISQLEEAQTVLQDILGTTAVGDDLEQLARNELARQEQAIKDNYDRMNDEVAAYFEANPLVSFQDALLNPAFDEELKAALPALAANYATQLINGFEDMTPEVQRAIARMIELDPGAFIDSTTKVLQATEDFSAKVQTVVNQVTNVGGRMTTTAVEQSVRVSIAEGENLEDAYARIKEQFPGLITTFDEFAESQKDKFELIETSVDSLYSETIPTIESALGRIADPINAADFTRNILELQNIDMSSFSDRQRELLFQNFPNLSTLLNLPSAASDLQNLYEQGGIGFIKTFDEVRSAVFDVVDDIAASVFRGASSVGGPGALEALGNQVSDALFDILSSGPITETAGDAINQIFRGALGGVTIPEEERTRLANAVLGMLPSFDAATLRTSIFGFADEFSSIAALAGKSINEFTQKDLELLAKYPDALTAIKNGQFDINEFKAKESEILLENLDAQRQAAIVSDEAARSAIYLARELGDISKSQARSALADQQALFEAELAELDILEEILTTDKALEESAKDRYKTQLDSLKSQKEAITAAQKIRDLQKDSAEIARTSLEATRIGAVGTLEAQFNQQQLNQEIAAMNQQLQDQIMLAQIEAQQKILEDSQQQAIQAATEANTTATEENTQKLTDLEQALIATAGATGAGLSATGQARTPLFDVDVALAISE